MNNLVTLIILFHCIALYPQEKKVEEGTLLVDYKSSSKVSKIISLNSSTNIKSKDLDKIKIKCKIESISKEEVDVNKFSLVDHNNKLRYRPTDISFQPVVFYMVYNYLTKENMNLNTYMNNGSHYKPEVSDSFINYGIDGYTDIEIPMQFGSGKNRRSSVVYFEPHKFKKFTALFYFAIYNKAANPDFELFYGDIKISDVQL